METGERHKRENAGHTHSWGLSVFIGGLEVRHCDDKDCPAEQAKVNDEWERI